MRELSDDALGANDPAFLAFCDAILARVNDLTPYEKRIYTLQDRDDVESAIESYRELKDINLNRLIHTRSVIKALNQRQQEGDSKDDNDNNNDNNRCDKSRAASQRGTVAVRSFPDEELRLEQRLQLTRSPASFFIYQDHMQQATAQAPASQQQEDTAVYFLVYNHCDTKQRTRLKTAISYFAAADFITANDYIVIDFLLTSKVVYPINLWRERNDPVYEKFRPSVLLSKNIRLLHCYYHFIYNSSREMIAQVGNYMHSAVRVIRFEDRILLGKQNPSQFSEGVLQHYLTQREGEQHCFSESPLPRLFLLIDQLHLETGAVTQFCNENGLQYAVLDRTRI